MPTIGELKRTLRVVGLKIAPVNYRLDYQIIGVTNRGVNMKRITPLRLTNLKAPGGKTRSEIMTDFSIKVHLEDGEPVELIR